MVLWDNCQYIFGPVAVVIEKLQLMVLWGNCQYLFGPVAVVIEKL